MSSNAIPDELDAILHEHLPRVGPEQDISPDLELVAEGGLDSLGMVGLVVALEEEFAVAIPDDRLGAEMFATPSSLWQSVRDLVEC